MQGCSFVTTAHCGKKKKRVRVVVRLQWACDDPLIITKVLFHSTHPNTRPRPHPNTGFHFSKPVSFVEVYFYDFSSQKRKKLQNVVKGTEQEKTMIHKLSRKNRQTKKITKNHYQSLKLSIGE